MRTPAKALALGVAVAVFGAISVLHPTFGGPEARAAEGQKPDRITIVSGVAGGVWFAISANMAHLFQGVRVSVEPGGGVSNVISVARGQAEMGFTMTPSLGLAYEGKAPFKEKYAAVVSIGTLFPNFTHIFVRKDAGITKVSDLKGKTFASQPPGTSTQVAFKDVLEAYGLSEADLKIRRGSQSEQAALVKDRHVVGMTATTGAPAGTLMEMASALPMRLLALDEEVAGRLRRANPGYVRMVLPAKTYAGQDQPVVGISSDTIMIVSRKMPADQVYWIVSTIGRNLARYRQSHAALRGLTLEMMASESAFPLHPGARRYYKEALGR